MYRAVLDAAIGADGATALAAALRKNTSLTTCILDVSTGTRERVCLLVMHNRERMCGTCTHFRRNVGAAVGVELCGLQCTVNELRRARCEGGARFVHAATEE